MVHGFGVHSKDLSRADNRGIGDEEMLTGYTLDPLMGGTGMRQNFVKIAREG